MQAIKERRIIFRLVWHKIWNIAIQNRQHEIGDTKEEHKIQSKRNLKCNKLHGLCSNRLGRHIFHSVWDRGVEREFRRTFVLPIVLFVVVFVFILTSLLKLFCLWNRNNFWNFSHCVWQKSMTGMDRWSLTAFSCCRRRRPTMPSVKYALLCHHWGT